jgi:hypothetical protein
MNKQHSTGNLRNDFPPINLFLFGHFSLFRPWRHSDSVPRPSCTALFRLRCTAISLTPNTTYTLALYLAPNALLRRLYTLSLYHSISYTISRARTHVLVAPRVSSLARRPARPDAVPDNDTLLLLPASPHSIPLSLYHSGSGSTTLSLSPEATCAVTSPKTVALRVAALQGVAGLLQYCNRYDP